MIEFVRHLRWNAVHVITVTLPKPGPFAVFGTHGANAKFPAPEIFDRSLFILWDKINIRVENKLEPFTSAMSLEEKPGVVLYEFFDLSRHRVERFARSRLCVLDQSEC
jgi:hypothetical protein